MRWTAVLILLAGMAILGLRLLFPMPSLAGRVASSAIPAAGDTTLGRAILSVAASHPGTSGILPLGSGLEAFAARMALAQAAERSIDAQYYIWQDDLTGLRLLGALQAAAERGVRVRLLVDDNGTPALDQEMAALDALPMAEVRYFNPFVLRRPRLLNYAFDFFRLNRRMHNKSFTVDGAVTIVGGRNIGNIYFETGSGHLYFDLDVLAAGPAAADVGADFDRYWASASAVPAALLIAADPGAEGRLAARDAALAASAQGMAYGEAVRATPIVAHLEAGTLPLEWVPATLFSDDPAKAEGLAEREELMIQKLMAAIGTPAHSVDIVSAYFIPGVRGTERIVGFAAGGARVRTLTNALAATDVVPVHAGYIGYREALLDAGVEVYELRAEGAGRRSVNDLGIEELSQAALHAKSMSIDGRRAFIGSFNFDPRSKHLNCEMGLLIDSPKIAAGMSDWLDRNLPQLAWRVTRGAGGGLVWTTTDTNGETLASTVEPDATLPLRVLVRVIGWLPVEWLL
ncbi:MAG: phospholipase D family protein [Defluviimonas sp.]|nr:phospholipase D family protein [Paracoccaceae bacterium]MCC0063826.1 phospholipase D family protein [Defluviimonas sp.]